jgi:hypothetical protein
MVSVSVVVRQDGLGLVRCGATAPPVYQAALRTAGSGASLLVVSWCTAKGEIVASLPNLEATSAAPSIVKMVRA